MKNNDWKDRLNVVYSTNSDYKYEIEKDNESETLPKEKQHLRITLDKKIVGEDSNTYHRFYRKGK